MTSVPHFPRLLLREKGHSWNLAGVATTPGVTAQSVAKLIRSDGGGFWTCSMSDISLSGNGAAVGHDRQRLSTLLWRAVRQVCDGGVNPIVVPRNDALFRPWPAGVPQVAPDPIPHDDGSLFSDGSGYYQPAINIVAAAAASLRATSMSVGIVQAGALNGGESFSVFHDTLGWRLYEIATVVYVDNTHATITFLPPLREAVAAGAELEFDRPRCTMRLAKTSSMDLSIQPWTFNRGSIDFVEAFQVT